jgi:hypothetical protein
MQFIGNVHGDEPVGREVLMHLANWLCDNYLKDPLVSKRSSVATCPCHCAVYQWPTSCVDNYSLRPKLQFVFAFLDT